MPEPASASKTRTKRLFCALRRRRRARESRQSDGDGAVDRRRCACSTKDRVPRRAWTAESDGESACPRTIRIYDTSCAVFKTGDCVPQVPPILSLRKRNLTLTEADYPIAAPQQANL